MKWCYFALLAAVFCSCLQAYDKKPEHSFYFWKTTFAGDSNDAKFILRNNIDHFYIHYFDVDWSEPLDMPVPIAEITGFKNSSLYTAKHYTPVIFITNKTFENFNPYRQDSFEYNIRKKIIFISNRIDENIPKEIKSAGKNNATAFSKIDEIQIDCDWTPSTKETYFEFLKKLKSILPGK
ncbi:MAG: hypothetical protein H7282_12225, partial [Cytophagaceae bacterium]|nr:hypothetical protein [Cytophagaceae bacterium]